MTDSHEVPVYWNRGIPSGSWHYETEWNTSQCHRSPSGGFGGSPGKSWKSNAGRDRTRKPGNNRNFQIKDRKKLTNNTKIHREIIIIFIFLNTIFVSSQIYPENPEGTQVIVGSMNMEYISDTAIILIIRNKIQNYFDHCCFCLCREGGSCMAQMRTIVWSWI